MKKIKKKGKYPFSKLRIPVAPPSKRFKDKRKYDRNKKDRQSEEDHNQ